MPRVVMLFNNDKDYDIKIMGDYKPGETPKEAEARVLFEVEQLVNKSGNIRCHITAKEKY